MSSSIVTMLTAVGWVTVAEMGDKTQLLAMAFATKYKAYKVLIGVFIATVFNHALAVAVGAFLARSKTMSVWVQFIAALSFIFFGLWTLRGDKLEDEEKEENRFGPIITVVIAFFIAELGDKTQLMTISLAAQNKNNAIFVLMGTTIGMLIADGIGIIAGVLLCKKIPEKTIKYLASAVFIIFGYISTYESLSKSFNLYPAVVWSILILLVFATALISYYLIKNNRENEANVIAKYCKVRNIEPQPDKK